jgi:hypothetical protein
VETLPNATQPAPRAPGIVFDWAVPAQWKPVIASAFMERSADDKKLAAEMRTQFAAVRAYHAARPRDVTSYRLRGIRPLTQDDWQDAVGDAFLVDDPPISVVSMVMEAAATQYEWLRNSGSRVHFFADARFLTERDGYHLIYGSLSLLAVAIRVDRATATDFKTALRRRGEPTIFVCDVPTAEMEDVHLAGLARCLRRRMQSSGVDPLLNFRFSIGCALPPAAILGHFHPQRAQDSLYGHHIGAA